MKTDGLFTVNQITVPCRLGQPLWLIPFGDIHLDSEHHAETEFKTFLAYLKRERKDARLLGMGDYNDFLRCHERALATGVASQGGDNIQNSLEASALSNVCHMRDLLLPFKNRILGLLSGNHYFAFAHRRDADGSRPKISNTHSDALLADMLGTKYMGVCAAITLTLFDSSAKAHADLRIVAHHGKGAAQTIGGSLAAVQKFLDGWYADVAFMGDDHKRGFVPIGDKLDPVRVGGEIHLGFKSQWVGRTGSFLRGYVPNQTSYVVDRAYRPTSLGWIELEMRLVWDEYTKRHIIKLRGLS